MTQTSLPSLTTFYLWIKMLEMKPCRSTIIKLFHVVQGCYGHSVAHIKYIPVTLSRTPPLLLMTQPLRLFRRPPWRLEWYKTHSGPVTQNCKDNSIFLWINSWIIAHCLTANNRTAVVSLGILMLLTCRLECVYFFDGGHCSKVKNSLQWIGITFGRGVAQW